MSTSLFRDHDLLAILALTLAACGGPSKPETTAPTPTEPTPAAGPALGTSGLVGLDWGANTEAVLAAFPRATERDGNLWYVGPVENQMAVMKFTLGAGGLEAVSTEWTDGFISMPDCGKTWATLRASLDGRFGASTADNLAAYWDTATASIVLACNPNDSDMGVLSLTYGHRDDN